MKQLNVELEIQLIPTDKGVRLLASCNEDYKVMLNTLTASDEFHYVVPSSRSDSMIIYPNGEVNMSILNKVLKHGNETVLYSQPYSDVELERTILILNGKFKDMKKCYQEMIENDGE